jgi:ribosome assembly protein YihI (activator of Der GTPase)
VQASPKKNQGATPKKTAKDPVLKSKVDVDLTMTEEVSPDLKKNSITPTITT